MDLQALVQNAQLFLLIFARIVAIIQIAPLLSSGAIPQMAKIGLSFFTAAAVFPFILAAGYPVPAAGLEYALLMVGEVLVGIIIGFIPVLIYSAFLVSGQFFSLQMGFGATQVFDPLAQIQIPLVGQFFNLIAMFIFLTIGGFQKLFLTGILRSFQTVNPYNLVAGKDQIIRILLKQLANLFEQALIISFPILGTLLLVSISMGLLAKAAPQMNLLMLGFPLKIGIAFIIILVSLPFITQAFANIIDSGFSVILRMLTELNRGTA